jgi:hypothetical protein
MPETETEAASTAESVTDGSAQGAEPSEADAKLKAFAHAMDSAGLKARVPSGMKYHAKDAPAGEAEAQETTAGATAPADKTGGKKPNPYEPPADLTQRKLADSYAAYVRKSTKLARQEAEFAERVKATQAAEARIKSIEEGLTKRQAELEADLKKRADELAFLEQDPAEWLDGYAKRRGMTSAALYDRLLGAKLNDGRMPPEHVADDARREIENLRAELAAMKKAGEDERTQAEKAKQEQQRQHEIAQAIHSEKVAFITHLRDEADGAYPLLLEEAKADPGAAANKAYELAVAHYRAGKALTVAEVAAEMERQLAYVKWREEEEAKASGAPQAPPASPAKKVSSEETSNGKGAPAPKAAAKPEIPAQAKSNGLRQASGPKTISSKMTARQSASQGLTTPRNDNERLKLAVAQWGKP